MMTDSSSIRAIGHRDGPAPHRNRTSFTTSIGGRGYRSSIASGVCAIALVICAAAACTPSPANTTNSGSRGDAAAPPPVSADDAREIAADTYTYAYPLVLAELTRRVSMEKASMNQFEHLRAFPDANFTRVVRPNADTLYSVLWFDVSKEPLAIRVPASGERYHLFEMLDMWTDVFASPGSRTTGNQEQTIVLAAKGWNGELPAGALLIHSPTPTGWIIGRTQTNGTPDYPEVHKFQDELIATPLSQFGTQYTAPKTAVDPAWDVKTAPVEQIAKMGPQEFFGLFAELMKVNPPHDNDSPMLQRMARIGIEAGQSFSLASASPEARQALEAAPAATLGAIKSSVSKSGVLQNGWRTWMTGIGTYGTDYRARARIAFTGLGANTIEDAIYPIAFTDGNGKPFTSDGHYLMHFAKDQIPPVRGFWSLTMYNDGQFFAANPINRYAIGDRDKLRFNADGSLDLYIQRDSPGADKESNWLPAPATGSFSMNLRMYWPKPQVLSGDWAPPPVTKVE
ncbi:DUF1254 domain-containing protein [Saccharopolyspora shandongensis]|uniref:DUF1254 domain-containing protein n=1 Tax=Saccharopolyspora shandongensis TaxID=418495 RepID=UPI0033FF961D